MSTLLGIPATTVHNRIKRLERMGVITRYAAIIDAKKMGKHLSAFVHVSVSYGTPSDRTVSQRELAERLFELPEVDQCYIITGASDLMLHVHATDVDELNKFITETLRMIKGVAATSTAFVLADIGEYVRKRQSKETR